MLKRFVLGFVFALVGYLATAVASYFLIMSFSSNVHDRSVEASMTAIFFIGPIGAVLGFAWGIIFGGRKSSRRS